MRLALLLVAFASYLPAATFVVTNTNDAGPGSLRQAVTDANAAAGADVVDATGIAGAIALASPLPDITSEIVINGPGALNLNITRAAFAPQNNITGTMFKLITATGASLTLNGLRFSHALHLEWRVLHIQLGTGATLNNCELERTGGIENNQSLTTNNSRFLRNSGLSCGAILQDGPENPVLTANDCLFLLNTVHAASTGTENEAGAIEERAGWVYLNNCELAENSARAGAGAVRAASHLHARNSEFRANTTWLTSQAIGGGAIRLEGATKEQVIERCWLRNNQSYIGGGICATESGASHPYNPPLILHCCMSANTATLDGGGVWATSVFFPVSLLACTLSGNQAGRYGGGAAAVGLDSCTVTLNQAGEEGGGMYNGGAVSSVFAANSALAYPDVHNASWSGGYNFFGIAPPSWWTSPPGLNGVQAVTDIGGTVASPLNAMLGPLQNNGGPTPTHLPLPGSPLIDRGGDYTTAFWFGWAALRATRLLVDARGLPRVVDMAGMANIAGGDGRDTGAVEVQMSWSFANATPDIRLTTNALATPSAPWRLELTSQARLVASVEAPFEVSALPGAGYGLHALGNATGTSIFYVRYRPQSGPSHDGTLTLRTPGGPAQHLPLFGRTDATASPGFIAVSDERIHLYSLGYTRAVPPPQSCMDTRVSGTGLTAPITVSVPLPYQISFTPSGPWSQFVVTPPPTDGCVPLTTVFVRKSSDPPANPHFLTAVSTGAATQSRALAFFSQGSMFYGMESNVIRPSDGEAVETLEFSTTSLNVSSAARSVICGPVVLTPPANVAVRVEGPFEISATPGTGFTTLLPPSVYTPTTPIYVRYNPTAGTSHRGRLYIVDPFFMSFDTVLIGVVQPAGQIQVSVPALTFVGLTGPSTAQSFTVSGTGLTEPVAITFPIENYWAGGGGFGSGGATLFRTSFNPNGPWGRHLVTPAPVGGVLPPTTIYVYFDYTQPPPSSETFAWRMDFSSRNAPTVRVHNICAPTAGIRPHVRGLRFRASVGSPSAPQSYYVQAVNAGAVTIAAPTNFEVSLSATGGFGSSLILPAPAGPVTPPALVYVRYAPSGGVAHNGMLAHSGTGVQTSNVELWGDVLGGFVEAAATSLSFSTDPGVASASRSYAVTGYGLTAPIQVTAPAPFEVSLSAAGGFGPQVTTAAPVNGHVAPTTIYVRYNPAGGASHGGTLLHTSAGAAPDTVILNGGAPEHFALIGAANLVFSTWGLGVPSPEQSYALTGVNAAGPITITAPPHFEVSLTSGSGFAPSVVSPAPVDGVVGPLTVYARYNPTAGLAHVGSIDHAGGVSLASLPVAGAVLIPTVQAGAASLQFNTPLVGTPSAPQSYSVAGVNLLAEIDIAVPAPFEIALSATGPWALQLQSAAPVAGVVAAFDVFVRYNPQAGASHAGSADHNTQGATPVLVALTGDVVPPPQLNVGATALAFGTQAIGAISAEQSYNVSGTDLLGPVTITAGAPFEISLTSGAGFGPQVVLNPATGTLAQTQLFVRYAPQSGGPHNTVLQHITQARAPVTVTLTGTVTPPPPPVVQVSTATLGFETAPGAASPEQSYTVSGTNMTAAITITAPQEFEVSLASGTGFSSVVTTDPPVSGVIGPTVIYARYNPAAGGAHNGQLSHTSAGATAKYVAVDGDVVTPPTPPGSAEATGCTAGAGFFWPLLALLWRGRARRLSRRGDA